MKKQDLAEALEITEINTIKLGFGPDPEQEACCF